ncbi:MAG: hypothetical protein P8X65_11145 [Syntrophobacterales bacterium]
MNAAIGKTGFRKLILILAGVLALLLLASSAQAVSIFWQGDTDDKWSTVSNWDLNREPVGTDDLFLPDVASGDSPLAVFDGTATPILLSNPLTSLNIDGTSSGTITLQ